MEKKMVDNIVKTTFGSGNRNYKLDGFVSPNGSNGNINNENNSKLDIQDQDQENYQLNYKKKENLGDKKQSNKFYRSNNRIDQNHSLDLDN